MSNILTLDEFVKSNINKEFSYEINDKELVINIVRNINKDEIVSVFYFEDIKKYNQLGTLLDGRIIDVNCNSNIVYGELRIITIGTLTI